MVYPTARLQISEGENQYHWTASLSKDLYDGGYTKENRKREELLLDLLNLERKIIYDRVVSDTLCALQDYAIDVDILDEIKAFEKELNKFQSNTMYYKINMQLRYMQTYWEGQKDH